MARNPKQGLREEQIDSCTDLVIALQATCAQWVDEPGQLSAAEQQEAFLSALFVHFAQHLGIMLAPYPDRDVALRDLWSKLTADIHEVWAELKRDDHDTSV